jgi:hypothetical protein
MRQDCRHYETRSYRNGDTMRRCRLDAAPEAPWRCPDACPLYERRLSGVGWERGSLVEPPTPAEPPGVGEGEHVAALLDEAEDIVHAALPSAVAEVDAQRPRRPWWRRMLPRRRR